MRWRRPGLQADLVVVDKGLQADLVMTGGEWRER
jgi:N-acetylglucosamine-6-phosphate deacetylase